MFGFVSFWMDLTDESVGKLFKLVGIVFGEKGLFLYDLGEFGFVFDLIFFGFIIIKFHGDPFFVVNWLSHIFFNIGVDN